MSPEPLVAALLGVVLVLYVLLGGADFGGGVWDLLATGSPRRVAQRRAIANAIGPIWEANHVWLICALVILFVCFPRAYAAVATGLHLPLTLMLFGVVLRGAAFVFRAYDSRRDDVQTGWSVVFASASTVTPILLGMVVGALSTGRVYPGAPLDLWAAWWSPFPAVVGALTLTLFACLAAIYLTVETEADPLLQEDFRRRALLAGGALPFLAWWALALARVEAPELWQGLWSARFAPVFQVAVALVGALGYGSVFTRRFRAARALVVVQVSLVIGGWAGALYPFVLPGHLTVYDSAPREVMWLVFTVLTVGLIPLIPTYAWMLWVFKGRSLGLLEEPPSSLPSAPPSPPGA